MGDVGPYAGQKVYDYVIQGLSGILDAQAHITGLKWFERSSMTK